MMRARTAVTGFGSAGVNALRNFAAQGARLRSIGRTMTFGVTLPIVGGAALATRASIGFSDQINQLGTQAGASAEQVGMYRQSILDYAASGKSSEGPEALADSMFRVVSGGYEGARAIETMMKAEELATVGRADLEASTLALVGAMNTGIEGTEDLDETIGILNATVGAGSMRMEDLASAMGTGLLARVAPLGVSLQDVGAALGLLTSQGMPANSASTRLAMGLGQLADVSPKAADALESLGLREQQLARVMQRDGMIPTLELLKERLGDLDQVDQNQIISDIFGGGRSSGAIVAMINNLDDLRGRYKQTGDEALNFDEALASVNAEPATNLKQAIAQLRTVLIAIGDEVMPKVVPLLVDMAAAARNAFNWFTELPEPLRKIGVGLILAAAVLGPLIFTLGIFASAIGGILAVALPAAAAIKIFFAGLAAGQGALGALNVALHGTKLAFLTNPIFWVGAAIVGAIAAIVILEKKFGIFSATLNFMKGIGESAFDWVANLGVFDAIATGFDAVKTAVSTAINFITDRWELFLLLFGGPLGLVVLTIIKNFDAVKNAVGWAFGAMKDVAEFVFGAIADYIGFHLEAAFAVIDAVVIPALSFLWDVARTVFENIVDLIVTVYMPIARIISWPIVQAANVIGSVWPAVEQFLKDPIGNAVRFIVSNFNSVVDFIGSVPGRISDAAEGMFDGIKQAFRSAINFIIRGWNDLEFSMPEANLGPLGSVGGFTLSTPNIPELARGGNITRSGSAWIAEEGPELVNLPTGAQVTPLTGEFGEKLRGAIREIIVKAYLTVDGRVLAEATATAIADDEARR